MPLSSDSSSIVVEKRREKRKEKRREKETNEKSVSFSL
jgi:hypothetical protein